MPSILVEKTCGSCHREFRSEADYFQGTKRWRRCSLGHLWFNCSCDSTLVITKGKFPWYSPDRFMTEEASSVFNKICQKSELPYISSVAMQLEEKIRDENADSAVLAKIAKNDPLIAANILEMANLRSNNKRANPNGISSIEHAISLLGRKTVSEIALVAAMKQFDISTQEYSYKRHWQEAYLVGLIAENLIPTYGSNISRDKAFLGGCLCNIGKIIGALVYPQETDEIYGYINNVSHLGDWHDGEQHVGLSRHDIFGEIAIGLWGLPDFLYNAVGHHKTPKNAHDFHALISFANQLGHIVRLEPHRVDKKILEYHKDAHHLNEEMLDKLVASLLPLNSEVDDMT